KAPWMPDRTEANPNELNQDDARYGFRCCHLKNIWTAPLPPETELSRQMTTSTTSIDIMGLRSEERFSRNAETDLVCRLLLEKKPLGGVRIDRVGSATKLLTAMFARLSLI